MSISIRELFELVAAGDDLAAEDAAFLCQRLDPFLWQKVLAEVGRKARHYEDAPPATPSISPDGRSVPSVSGRG